MCDPQNLAVQDELRTFLGYDIRVVVATEAASTAALDRYYGDEHRKRREHRRATWKPTRNWPRPPPNSSSDGPIDLTSVEALADSAPVRKLLNMVLLLAIKDHASDLHFEPFEDEFRIRIKADGVLYEMVPPPRHLAFAITTRIKVMANLDIAERRLPQDGRIELTVGGHPVDLRVSVLPTMFGESVVMRVLDRSVVSLDLDKVGMNDDDAGRASARSSASPTASCWSPGPTGSGKTTTLYSALNELNTHRRQADHHRGPGRVRHRRHHPGADRRGDRQHVRPRACGRSCGRTRTRSWSARFATWRRPRSPCRRR